MKTFMTVYPQIEIGERFSYRLTKDRYVIWVGRKGVLILYSDNSI